MTNSGASSAYPLAAGVVGWPISHSLSPLLHTAWLNAAGLQGGYVAIALEPETARERLLGLSRSGLAGVNVTTPHKGLAYEIADRHHLSCDGLDAANLLIFHGDTIEARNTDQAGFLYGLDVSGLDVSGAQCLVLGAGGAAVAVIAALLSRKVSAIGIANRTADKVAALIDRFADPRLKPLDWDDRQASLRTADLIVNTTSLGMSRARKAGDLDGGAGAPALSPLENLDDAGAQAIVYDLVYTPLETPLLALARARGLRMIDGLWMLIGQARPSFEAFFGQPAPESMDARGLLIAALDARA